MSDIPASARTWVASAGEAGCEFPLQNLPYGVARLPSGEAHCVVAIGDRMLSLRAIEEAGLLAVGREQRLFAHGRLNPLFESGPAIWGAVRRRLHALLAADGDPALRGDSRLRDRAFHSMMGARMCLPFEVTEYTDFYASRQHAFNVGSLFRGPENALPPNWLHIPIGYNGRASTVVVSDTPVRRPLGQTRDAQAAAPAFGPCRRLDIELEMGAVVGTGNQLGEPVSVAQAQEMIFGFVLLNDWSARDIQAWEYQPLGPFQAKAFATSISPWVVPRAALEAFAKPPPDREEPLLAYLRDHGHQFYDIELAVDLRPAESDEPTRVATTNARNLYYSAAQQLAHHAVSGCRMRPGDLLGSGTISGQSAESCGSLLELTAGGANPIELASGERRTFLEDGDEVTLRGWADGDDYRVGFGECAGQVMPALNWPE